MILFILPSENISKSSSAIALPKGSTQRWFQLAMSDDEWFQEKSGAREKTTT
jgi:hypothetical protein